MRKILPILGAAVLVVASSSAYATPIYLAVGDGTTGDNANLVIGEVFSQNDLSGPGMGLADRDEAMIDALRLLDLGDRTTRTIGVVPEYYRSENDFGILPDAVQNGAVLTTPDLFVIEGDWLVVSLDQRYLYLVGSYGGKNGGSEVWYIGGIEPGTPMYIPFTAEPAGTPTNLVDSHRYQATSWTAYNPVPDGGTTSALLGLAMLGFGVVRRFVR